MKCLSLWQPWASLLVHGRKRVETRGWPITHRGPLLIHAAKKWNGSLRHLCATEPFLTALVGLGMPNRTSSANWKAPTPKDMPFGEIVGRVAVVECYPTEGVDFDRAGLDVTPRDPVWQYAPGKLRLWPEPEEAFGDYGAGRFAFLCADFTAFAEPIPYRGMQGLFEVPDDVTQGAK